MERKNARTAGRSDLTSIALMVDVNDAMRAYQNFEPVITDGHAVCGRKDLSTQFVLAAHVEILQADQTGSQNDKIS